MEETELKFSLFTPENPILNSARVKEVLVPSVKGQLGILPGHTGLISLLSAGVLKYRPTDSGEWEKVAVGWGYVEVFNNKVRVLAETAQTRSALKTAETEKKLRETESALKNDDLDPPARRTLERERRRLQAELDLEA